ncbi:MAG: hypothetical protein ABEK02_08595 [Haloquadratum sp.]
MTTPERYATVGKRLAAVLAVLGVWIAVAPFVLSSAEFELTHIVVGGSIAALAAGYILQLHREPETKLASLWFILVLGVLLLSGVLLAHTPGTVFFWSTVVTSALVVFLAIATLLWGSRFGASKGETTTIFEK